MCGLVAFFPSDNFSLAEDNLRTLLKSQSWRGPDNTGVWIDDHNRAYLGHNRLTILDSSSFANMPISSTCMRYVMIFNGEIYNYKELKKRFQISCKTHSDSEVLINLYAKIGSMCLNYLEGMFSFIIFDKERNQFFAARDQLGIKPLYYGESNKGIAFGSEAAVLNDLIGGGVNEVSIREWRILRRPIAGKTFFKKIQELPPGCYYDSEKGLQKYWVLEPTGKVFNHDEFKTELTMSVKAHLMNDYDNVSLLSGGLDSAVILGLSGIKKSYTIGLPNNNEFYGAQDSADVLGVNLVKVQISSDELMDSWRSILKFRREPLSVPNEGLIYWLCKSMSANEKVVLTGEGADELLFGYDQIFLWASSKSELTAKEFIERYAYAGAYVDLNEESLDYIADLMRNKSPLEFLEDFFIQVHLPGLLRRMDSASMCASKEARVPFVTAKLFSLVYRQSIMSRYTDGNAKGPLRLMAKELHLNGALTRKKIGFSATFDKLNSKKEYEFFQKLCLDELGWN
jgi:asparagine synthase (glutamine-hydrolysing)